eukprot:3114146-Pyramimonas_sp.AAC.1
MQLESPGPKRPRPGRLARLGRPAAPPLAQKRRVDEGEALAAKAQKCADVLAKASEHVATATATTTLTTATTTEMMMTTRALAMMGALLIAYH